MRGKKRPTTERARAVGIAVVAGGAEASRQTGIPRQTIDEWLHSAEFGELRQRTKEEVAEEWWAGVQAYQRAIMAKLDGASLRDTVGAFMIMNQQLMLIRGEATTRVESRDLTYSLDDHELDQLREFLQRHATAQHPPEAAVAGAGSNGATPAER